MINKKSILTVFMVLVFVFLVELIFNTENIMEETLSRYGSSGSEVRNIQTKLKKWGYYNGVIAARVDAPAIPSAVNPFFLWKALTAETVLLP